MPIGSSTRTTTNRPTGPLSAMLAVLAIAVLSNAPTPSAPTNDPANISDRIRNRIESPTSVAYKIRATFDVPICIESHPIYGRLYGDLPQQYKMDFRVYPGESLEQCLKRFGQTPPGLLTTQKIGKIYWILPAKKASGEQITNLDITISLDIKTVSTWEALKQIVRAVNARRITEGKLLIQPASLGELVLPPAKLSEDTSISLSVSDVTAREAISRVIEVSPVPADISYITSLPNDYINVCTSLGHTPRSQAAVSSPQDPKMQWWVKEIDENNL